ncbi:IS3 family transposase [Streptomyces sp. NPDC048506]|uniref:IS3 family transposase n=1 Tax=Streptomyces sp. NPDC048506 TaxID=3155028 RepID=UPI003413B260
MPGPRAVRDAELTEQITAVHEQSRGTYGAPRIHAVLQREGTTCGRRRIAKLMRVAGLTGLHRRRQHRTTTPWLPTQFPPPYGPFSHRLGAEDSGNPRTHSHSNTPPK